MNPHDVLGLIESIVSMYPYGIRFIASLIVSVCISIIFKILQERRSSKVSKRRSWMISIKIEQYQS